MYYNGNRGNDVLATQEVHLVPEYTRLEAVAVTIAISAVQTADFHLKQNSTANRSVYQVTNTFNWNC